MLGPSVARLDRPQASPQQSQHDEHDVDFIKTPGLKILSHLSVSGSKRSETSVRA